MLDKAMEEGIPLSVRRLRAPAVSLWLRMSPDSTSDLWTYLMFTVHKYAMSFTGGRALAI